MAGWLARFRGDDPVEDRAWPVRGWMPDDRSSRAEWSANPTLTIPEEVLMAQMTAGRRAFPRSRTDVLWKVPVQAGRLIELVLAERITVERRRCRLLWGDAIVVVDTKPVGDPFLDAALECIGASGRRSCAYWVSRLGLDADEAYWDRLVAKSLLRPDTFGPKPDAYVVDADCAAAITDRVRAVLEQRPSVTPRDAALVTLLAQAKLLLPLLHESRWSPTALIRERRDRQREDRLGRQAIDDYRRLAPSPATAEDIRKIALAVRPPDVLSDGGGVGAPAGA
jgi:Golgi phosphoprotein 3 GPP34